MAAIQMIKKICIGSKFEQLSRKIGDKLPSRNKTDSEFILILTMSGANINNLKSEWSREIAQAQDLTTAFIDGERNLLPEKKKMIKKYWQYTMTAIQMIKRIRISSKFERKIPGSG